MIWRGRSFDSTIQGIVLLLVFGTPLALGAVHVPAMSAFLWLALAAVLVWVLKTVWIPPAYSDAPAAGTAEGRRGRRLSLFGHEIALAGIELPFVLFVLLVLFQLTPLPHSIVSLVSPGAARLYENSLPGYASGEGVDFSRTGAFLLGPGHDAVVGRILRTPGALPVDLGVSASSFRTLSVYPFATVNRLLMLLALWGVFFVVVNVFRSRTRIEMILRAIVLYGFALAIFGIVQRLSWNGKIYWVIAADPGASPFGPFINHNHFAAFLVMIVPLATGMLMDEARRLSPRRGSESGSEQASPRGTWSGRRGGPGLLALHGPEPFARLLLTAFVVGVMAAAVVLSASRGAVLALAGAFVLYGGALAVQGRIGRPETAVAAALLVVAIGLSIWLGAGPLAQKLKAIGDVETEPSLVLRVVGWQWTMKIVGDFTLLGTGLGTFTETWAHYYPPGTAAVWREAHNDYLQLLSETGVVGIVLFAIALGVFAWKYLLPGVLVAGRRRDGYTIHGVVVGIIAVALHSIVDFPLQITGCAVLLVVLAGLLVAHRRRMEMAQ